MGRDFSVMKANVSSRVQNTSTSMQTLIGQWLNRRYFQILRSINWEYINEDYTVTTVAGTQDYVLPADFGKEMYAVDSTNNTNLKRIDFEEIVRNYSSELEDSGYPERYAIFNSDDGSKYLRLHFVPNGAYNIVFPYMVKPTALSADTDEPVLGLEDVIEIGAEGDAWRYMRQFSKGKEFEMMFNNHLADYIWDKENQPNQVMQFKPVTFNKSELY